MFVNNEITDRGMLSRMLRKAALEVTMDERKVWARSIEGAVKDASRSSVPLRNRVARPVVVLAAAPALSTVAAMLRDETAVVSRASLDAVRTFMTNGIDSPFFGRDPLAARRGADALRRRFVAQETARRTHEAVQHTAA
jgi:hypothetical protein